MHNQPKSLWSTDDLSSEALLIHDAIFEKFWNNAGIELAQFPGTMLRGGKGSTPKHLLLQRGVVSFEQVCRKWKLNEVKVYNMLRTDKIRF